MPTSIVMRESEGADCSQVDGPSSLTRSGGAISGMGCTIPEFWAVIGGLWYLGY
jgi:hypothetical protein